MLILLRESNLKPQLYGRYIDDCIGATSSTKEELTQFKTDKQTAEKENTDRIPFTLTFQRVPSYTHHKLELVSKGFLISKSKPFLGASMDNIQRCQCSDGCPNKVLEYKCPWKHRDMHPKEAFLTPEIGGTERKNGFAWKPSSQYYFQLQLQMFVNELSLNILVV